MRLRVSARSSGVEPGYGVDIGLLHRSNPMMSAPSRANVGACDRPWLCAMPLMKATLPSSCPTVTFVFLAGCVLRMDEFAFENSCRTTSSVVSSIGRYVCGAGRSFALPVKADVGRGKVLREGAVLHEAGEARRTETVMEFTLGGVHSTRKEHL